MLLSIPTWIIHISSMIEWGLAALFLYRYGKEIQRDDVKRFALLMLPHWAGGWCVIVYHLTNDTVLFWLDASKVVNFVGSVCLLYASLSLLLGRKFKREALGSSAFLFLVFFQSAQTFPELYWRAKFIETMFQISSGVYLLFLVSLLFVYRRDKSVFSPVTVFGFWFVLVFIGVTVVCMYFSKLRGYPTLTHDDLLHGLAESLLTMSNLLIVIGIQQQRKEVASIGNPAPFS
ncbi:MAG: DUF2499 domain-containing protein [Chloroherpetonaceae bacterium]